MLPCQRSSDHRCVGSFLGLKLYSIGLLVYHYTSTMQFLSQLLGSTAKVQHGVSTRGSFIIEKSVVQFPCECWLSVIYVVFEDQS